MRQRYASPITGHVLAYAGFWLAFAVALKLLW